MSNEVIVPAVERALDIIEYLNRMNSPRTIKEMSEDLDIPIASLFRIVKNLTVRNYLAKIDGYTSKYAIGYKIPQIAANYPDQFVVTEVARDYMIELSNRTNQTTQLLVYNGMNFFYIDQVMPNAATLQFLAMLYQPLDINTSAGAKCVLALMPEKERDEIIEAAHLEKKTDRTVTDKNIFREELKRVSGQGWAIDMEEFHIGIACIAAPVFFNGVCVGAIGITGGAEHYKDAETFSSLKDVVTDVANRMSEAGSRLKK